MKKLLLGMFLVLSVVSFGEDKEIKKEVINFAPKILNIELENVRIKIVGEDRKDVEAEYFLGDDEVKIEQLGETLKIISTPKQSNCKFLCFNQIRNTMKNRYLELKVPKNIEVQINNENGGINLENIVGNVDIKNSNSKIELKNINGNVTAKTSNGRIEVENIQGIVKLKTSNGKIIGRNVDTISEIKTSNGSVNFVVNNVTENSYIKTSNGSIEVELKKTDMILTADTSNGKIKVKTPSSEVSFKEFNGQLGNGKNKLDLKTSNGSITINSPEGFTIK